MLSLVQIAYHHYLKGEPMPIDVEGGLLRQGINPEKLLKTFERRRLWA